MMKQVPREDFETLSKYHPAEIRYFVDTSTEIKRRKPSRVTVKRPPSPVKKSAKRSSPRPVNGTGTGFNLPVIYKGGDKAFGEKSVIGAKVESAVSSVFHGDPTKIIGKADLINKIIAMTTLHRNSVAPAISFLIKKGILAHKEAAV